MGIMKRVEETTAFRWMEKHSNGLLTAWLMLAIAAIIAEIIMLVIH